MIFEYKDAKDLVLGLKYHSEWMISMQPSAHSRSYTLSGDIDVLNYIFGDESMLHNVKIVRESNYSRIYFKGDTKLRVRINAMEKTATLTVPGESR